MNSLFVLKEQGRVGSCSTHGRDCTNSTLKVLVLRTEGKGPLGSPRCSWEEYNIKEIKVGWILVA
jgi:hypothetical protein